MLQKTEACPSLSLKVNSACSDTLARHSFKAVRFSDYTSILCLHCGLEKHSWGRHESQAVPWTRSFSFSCGRKQEDHRLELTCRIRLDLNCGNESRRAERRSPQFLRVQPLETWTKGQSRALLIYMLMHHRKLITWKAQ